MKIMKNQKGFSLIELLVVVIIIGIIAAIAVPSLLSSRKAANEASAVSALRSIHTANMTWSASYGSGNSFAPTFAELGNGTNTTTAFYANVLDATVIGATSSTTPKSGYVFTYTTTGPLYCTAAAPSGTTTGTKSYGVETDGVLKSGATSTTVTCASGALSGGTVLN